MKKATRIVALLILLCLTIVTVSACNGEEEEGTESSAAETSKPAVLFEKLPEKDYGGETVTFLVEGDYRTNYKSQEIMAQEGAPEVLNEQIEKRNELVESKFNVVIAEERTTADQPMLTLVRNAVLSSLEDYDIVMPYIPDAATLALEDSFHLINDLEYIDLNNRCWDNNATESLSINHKNYFITGDISLLTLACTHAIVFNKDIISANGMENPYDLVNNGQWTYDKLREMARKVTADIDGTAGMSATDRYGFLINNNFVTSMYVGSGQSLTGKDINDIPYISIIDESETAFPIFNKIFELVNDETATGQIDNTSSTYYTTGIADGSSIWEVATESVANGLALFRAMAIIDIIDLGDYDCNFGILPVPKYSESQENHHSLVSTIYASSAAIPISAPDSEMSSIILQAMCEASTDTTKDAYFEIILKLRRIQDDESEAMLDKIFDERVYDLGIIYNWGGANYADANSIGNFMNAVAFSGTQTFASTLESITDVVKNALEDTLEVFES
ncbi:MAG: hypothetical protein E7595_01625 [Ruminococcaceae bacterium]|nr:hypothetical protein [Oscillospiraceae bacterium]